MSELANMEPGSSTDPDTAVGVCEAYELAPCTTNGPDCACNGSRVRVVRSTHRWGPWEDDPVGAVRECQDCFEIEYRPEG